MTRLERLTAIVLLLQQKKIVTARELADHFSISIRTIYRDMKSLDEAGIPLAAEAGEGYQLLEGFNLPPVMFTETEASALFIGGKFVEKNTDQKLKKQIESALMKIYAVLPASGKNYVDRMISSTAVVDQSKNSSDNDADLSLLQNSIINRNCLTIEYFANHSQEETVRVIEPLGLIYYTDNWHLVAFCRLRRDLRNFRTDRIQKIKVHDEKYPERPEFSILEFIKQQQENSDAQEFCVKFRLSVFKNIAARNLFGLVSSKQDGDFVTAVFIVPDISHMINWLISFGDQVTVMYPDNLKMMMLERIDIIRNHIRTLYEKP